MSGSNEMLPVGRVEVDADAQPCWQRTGYKFFPYAAQQDGRWWVLRLNVGFPEHDMYTVFVDGHAAVDVTGGMNHPSALVRSIAALGPHELHNTTEPVLAAHTAATVVFPVSRYVNYGSEHGQECSWCSAERDGMARTGHHAATR